MSAADSKAEAKALKDKEKERMKINKKRMKFLDPSSNLSTRSKALLSFCELEADEAVGVTFRDHHVLVFSSFVDTMSFAEANSKKGKHLSEKEAKSILAILRNIITHLKADIKDSRNTRSVLSAIEKLLYIENMHSIRMMAFGILLMFLESVPESEEAWKLVIASLNLQAYQGESGNVVLLPATLAAPERGMILVPNTGSASGKKESQEILDQLLTWAERSFDSFVFWFETIRAILALLFPEACISAGVPGAAADRGFSKGSTPGDLQSVLFMHLASRWIKNDQLLEHFVKDPRGYLLLLEFLRSALRLNPSHSATTLLMLKTLFPFFVLQRRLPPNLTLQQLIDYQKVVLEDSAYVFGVGPQDGTELIGTCNAVIKLYATCLEQYNELEPATRKAFLFTVLKAAQNLLSQQPMNPNGQAIEALKTPVMDNLLICWLSSQLTDPDMWSDFHKAVEPLMANPEVIRQIKLKLMHLTLIIKETCYPIPPPKAPKDPKDAIPGKQKKEKIVWSLDMKDAIEKTVVRDQNLSSIQWNPEVLLWVWHALLHSLHNVNSFKNPRTHEGAMNVLTDVMDLLLQAEEAAILDPPGALPPADASKLPKIPLITVFGQYFFAACKLDDQTRVGGITLAYGALCRMLCRRYPLLPVSLLSHWYSVLRNGLLSPEKLIGWTIITNSYNIFSISVPGSSILIPYYISKAKELLLAASSPPPSALNGKQKIVSLLSSLVCYPAHFPSMSVPSMINEGKNFTASMLRDTLYSTLIAALYVPQINTECKTMALWSIVVSICEEFAHFNGEKVSELTHALLAFVSGDDAFITRTALQCLSFLAQYGRKMPADLANTVIDSLCTATLTQKVPDTLMPYVYIAIVDWIVTDITLREHTQQKLFMSIEYGIVAGSGPGDNENNNTQQVQNTNVANVTGTGASSPSGIDPHKGNKPKNPFHGKRSLAQMVRGVATGMRAVGAMGGSSGGQSVTEDGERTGSGSGGGGGVAETLGIPDKDRHLTVREAAEILIGHALHFRGNFPSAEGIDLWCSRLMESDDNADEETGSHWILNAQNLITAVDVNAPNQSKSRLLIRESAGKWTWDFSPVRIPSETELPESSLTLSEANTANMNASAMDDFNENATNNSRSSSSSSTVPRVRGKTVCGPSFMLNPKNHVSELLESVQHSHPELQSWTGSLTQPEVILAKFKQTISESEQHVLSLAKSESTITTPLANHQPNSSIPESPNSIVPGGRASTSRLLLQQVGLLSPLSPLTSNFERMLPTEKFKRNVSMIDKAPGRSTHKIGLIYVHEGQENQNEILANGQGSALYKDFVAGLGWSVDVTSHRGYLGGLDKNCSCGQNTLYWADSLTEVIFHEVVQMPTKEGDQQQIQKKRHVGNDFVHIIWCEHVKDYNPLTITSQFNDAHIVIYPLPSGLFRVQVFRNPQNQLFGPIQHGMVLNKELLAMLVRETAINADRVISSQLNPEPFSRPYLNRQRLLFETTDRYSAEDATFLSNISTVSLGIPLALPHAETQQQTPPLTPGTPATQNQIPQPSNSPQNA